MKITSDLFNRDDKASIIETSLVLLLTACVAAFFFYTIWRCAVNIPFTDDYTEILMPLNIFASPDGSPEKWTAFFSSPGYSKALFMRGVTLVSFLLLGSVDFKLLILIGNLGLIGLLIVLYKASSPQRPLFILPVIFLLLQWQYWEASLEATLALSVPMALFFSFLSMLLLRKDTNGGLAASVIFAVLATFSFGNGFLIFPVAILLLMQLRRFRDAAAMLAAFVLSMAAFLYGHSPQTTDKGLWILFTMPGKTLDWFLTFLGSSIGYANDYGYAPSALPHAASLFVGSLILGFYIYLTLLKYYKRNPTLYAWYSFMLLTALVAVRCRLFDEVPTASRYQIQSIILVIITYLAVMDLLNDRCRKIIFPVVLLASVCFFFSSYFTCFPTTCLHKNRLIFGMSNWLTSGSGLISCGPDQNLPNTVLLNAAKAGIYCIPDADYIAKELIIVPGSYNSYYQRGMLHGRARNYTQAITDLSTAISNSPSFVAAYDGRMRIYHAMGDYDRSWSDANTLIKSGNEIDAGFLKILKAKSAEKK